MPVRIEPHAEPIPGYKLIERLGGGGFGEVWKAEAPGGLFKAIKFVYGELETDSLHGSEDPSRALQELKALSRVKTVHHPYILSLERYDIVDNQLMIVMELADRTLWDRFRECRSQGLPGIPREELLRYMGETAEALDLMNTQFQLQHLDIKPQNLFLIFNHVKVADFGLVKDLGSKGAATVTGGVTPVYAAPETFDGWLSRFSDQYSLAIVYQELLTGQRPFTGGTMRQLVLQHIQGKPDLAPLPLADRPIVGRALSKNPDERYPSCVDFVTQLRAGSPPPAVAATGAAAAAAPVPADPTIDELTLPAAGPPLDSGELTEQQTLGARGAREALKAAPLSGDSGVDYQFLDRPQILPPRPDRKAAPEETAEDEPSTALGRPGRTLTETESGVLQPALVLGLGKLGLETLRDLRQRLNFEFGSTDAIPQLRLFGIDTDPEALQETGPGLDAGLRGHETLLARLHRPSHYVKAKQAIENWLNPKLIYRIPRDQNNAGIRPLGRLALVDNFRAISRRLEAELEAFRAREEAGDTAVNELGVRSHVPRVYLVTSLTGNTGSGMFVDVAYLIRHLLRKLDLGGAEIIGLFYVPSIGRTTPPTAVANTYAALMELNHFAQGHTTFSARYPVDERHTMGERERHELQEDGPPLQRCFLLSLPEVRGTLTAPDNRAAVGQGGAFLVRELTTPLGRTLDEQRRQQTPASPSGQRRRELSCHAFGQYRLAWPRPAFLEGSARRLCARLLERWMSKDARPLVAALQQWSTEKMELLELRPEHLIGRMHEWTEKSLKQPVERFFGNLNAGSITALGTSKPQTNEPPSLASLLQLAQQLDVLLGVPEECRPPNQAIEPGSLERLLQSGSAKLGEQMEQKLAELAVLLIEDPGYRLAGAEEALRQFSANVEHALSSQETLARELQERAAQLYTRIQQFPESPTPTTVTATTNSMWKPSFIRRSPPPGSAPSPIDSLTDLLRNYAKARYHSLVLGQINRFYVGLRGQLSDQIREVGFCRQRLTELIGLVGPQPPQQQQPVEDAQVRLLLPAACMTLEDAIEQADRALTPADLVAFDRRAQGAIELHHRALVQVCMGSSNTVRKLAPQLIHLAERFLEQRLEESSVAEMYFSHLEGVTPSDIQEGARQELRAFFDKALPRVGPQNTEAEIAVVTLADNARGQELRRLLESELPRARVEPSSRTDEILFYRERQHLALGELEQTGAAAREVYQQRLAQDPSALHTREDLGGWQPIAAP